MISSLRNFAKTKIAGVFVFIIIIPFVFWGMGSMFNSGNTNNIAEINNTKISTKDFMDFVNKSGIQQNAIKENLDKNIIEELLSALISATLLDLEIRDFDINLTEQILLKKIKSNINFVDKNNNFQRTAYEKFLLTNNISAPMFEQKIRGDELQKKLFDYIGAGTVIPNFLLKNTFEDENKIIKIDYVDLNNFYKKQEEFTKLEKEEFIKENLDVLKREHIDFEYVQLSPKNLIGINEFNQDFFDQIDNIENKISDGISFKSIIENIDVMPMSINNYKPNSNSDDIMKKIYSFRSSKMDILENGDNFLLFNILNKYDRSPDLDDRETDFQITEMIYQKNKFDKNKQIIKEIDNKEFNDSKFKEIGNGLINTHNLNSINDDSKFNSNSVKILYSLPLNSFTLISDKDSNIFLINIKDITKKVFNNNDENYLDFTNRMSINNKKSLLKSYDLFLNDKYKVELNQKTIERVKNYFK